MHWFFEDLDDLALRAELEHSDELHVDMLDFGFGFEVVNFVKQIHDFVSSEMIAVGFDSDLADAEGA